MEVGGQRTSAGKGLWTGYGVFGDYHWVEFVSLLTRCTLQIVCTPLLPNHLQFIFILPKNSRCSVHDTVKWLFDDATGAERLELCDGELSWRKIMNDKLGKNQEKIL